MTPAAPGPTLGSDRPMLSIGPARQAAELRRAAAQDAAARVWHRKIFWFWVRYLAGYGSGLGIIGYGFHTTDYEIARTAWEVGFLVALLAPLANVLHFWWREMR